eukprot:4919395-Amphidinium_carterae.2
MQCPKTTGVPPPHESQDSIASQLLNRDNQAREDPRTYIFTSSYTFKDQPNRHVMHVFQGQCLKAKQTSSEASNCDATTATAPDAVAQRPPTHNAMESA